MTTQQQVLESILLSNDNGMSVEIINFGARIKSIKFPVNAIPTEMILSYESAQEYTADQFYSGATCGRVCNRISQGKFEVDGKIYQLSQNDGENCLHGGEDNFSMRYWQINKNTVTCSSVTLTLHSQDGDQGFPGNAKFSVKYQLQNDNKLVIEYLGNTDKATPINFTNHAYFTLGEQSCESLYLQMHASTYLESDETNIPTGNIISVIGTDFDFRENKHIGKLLFETQDKSLLEKKGYDHCFVLDKGEVERPKAILTSVNNQVSLSVYTNQLAIQLYTGFYLSGQFKPYQGLCLEAQNYTDAENHDFPTNIVQPNQQYKRQIIFEFQSIK